nr:MAG TPA: hypothetical protein [Caudoviricetes sp.]
MKFWYNVDMKMNVLKTFIKKMSFTSLSSVDINTYVIYNDDTS